jgi:hypothetical protein
MNRGVTTLVAIATLLALALALHSSGEGALAPPFDAAHASFQLGRNLALEGNLSWGVGVFGLDSTPSPLWVLLCTLGEALPVPVTLFSQVASMVAAVATLALVMRFSGSRLAGLTAVTLLVTLGAMASAAAAGTETMLVAALLMGTLYTLQRGWTRALALVLVLLWWTRPDAALAILVCLGLTLWARRRIRSHDPAPSPVAFLPVVLIITLEALLRPHLGHPPFPPAIAAMLDGDPERIRLGFTWLWDMARSSVSPLLGLAPLALCLVGRLSRLGCQALALALAWLATVILQGGSDQPFLQNSLPAMPLLFLAVQEALFVILDSGRWGTEKAAWAVILLGIFGSAFASRFPADLGPLPTEGPMRSWQSTSRAPGPGRRSILGRASLADELEQTQRLRRLGNFMREHMNPEETILTPWPGAISYLSRMPTRDLLGRATLAPGQERLLPWAGPHRVDVVLALNQGADYVLFTTAQVTRTPAAEDIATDWMRRLDNGRGGPERLAEILKAMGQYEMVGVFLGNRRRRPDQHRGTVLFFLRRRALDLAPSLEVVLEGDRFRVQVHQRGHQQLANLTVEAYDSNGHRWHLRPSGEWTTETDARARRGLLLVPTGSRTMLLVEQLVPHHLAFVGETGEGKEGAGSADPPRIRLIRARLANPGARGSHRFASVCEPASAVVLPE